MLAGISNPVRSGSNSALNKAIRQPPFLGLSLRDLGARVAQAPWWVWLGGICNATFLFSTLIVAKRVGAGTFTTLVLTAAVITSVLLDRFGLLGFEQRPATLLRLVGGAFTIGGAFLVSKF